MLKWLSTNYRWFLTMFITVGVIIFVKGCEPSVRSIINPNKTVTRSELQIELDQINATAAVRLADLQKQEQFRQILLQNALLVAQGTPIDPFGLITGIAGIYGVVTAGRQITSIIKNGIKVAKKNNE